jgi:alkylation response protein AidB-like acyl-CoA dehydrogenase
MISFDLSEEQQAIQELAADFAKAHVRPVAARHDETKEYPWDAIKAAHEMGLLNTHIPMEYGGMELGAMDGMGLQWYWNGHGSQWPGPTARNLGWQRRFET